MPGPRVVGIRRGFEAEPGLVAGPDVSADVAAAGPDRLMFGSDWASQGRA
jgi:predicted TIM-barrel fold metal-dependent hydrolase